MKPWAAGVVAVACVAQLAACRREAPEDVESETAVPVTAEAVTRGNIRATVHATGVVAPAPAADLTVIAPEAARIAAIPKAEGDAVRRGDVLVRFDIPSLTADSATKRADVARATARLTNARAARARAHDLFERGVAARKEVEDADRDLSDAEAELAAAQAGRAASEQVAARTVVRATFDGVVARRFHNPGDFVEPSASDPILRILDPRRLEVSASIPIGAVSHVIVGASGRLVDGSGHLVAALKVLSRPALVDPGTAAVPLRLGFVTPTRMPAGTPVQIELDAEEHTNVLLVPATAVVHEGEATAVFVVSGDKAERRDVQVGLSDGDRVEVVGVKEGEMVVIRGQNGLPDGAFVTLTAGQR